MLKLYEKEYIGRKAVPGFNSGRNERVKIPPNSHIRKFDNT